MSDRPTPITDAAMRYCVATMPCDQWADYMAKFPATSNANA